MKKNRSILKIIASTSVTLFSLFACFLSTFAWFLAQRAVDADGNGFITNPGVKIIERIDVFQEVRNENSTVSPTDYLYLSEAYCSYTAEDGWKNKTDTELTTPIQLGTYSQEDNTHSVLIVITLSEALDSYTLDFSTTTTYDDSRVKSGDANLINQASNPMSSFIDFRYLDLESSLNATDSKYDLSNEITTNEMKSFVNPSSPSSEDDYQTTTTIDSDSDGTKYIAIIVEYNVSVVNYIFYTLNFSNDLLDSSETNIPFTCDWSINLR